MRLLTLTLITAAALLWVVPSNAMASSVGIGPDGALLYAADPGEVNDVSLSRIGGAYDVVEATAVMTSDGTCTVDAGGHHAVCAGAVDSVLVTLGDMDDHAVISDSAYPAGPPPPGTPLLEVDGEAGADRLTGAAGPDTFLGGAGDDVLTGLGGADSISGDAGNDLVDGGAGDDVVVHGGSGDDAVFAGSGSEIASGQEGDDMVDGGPGDDEVIGGPGNDQIFGGDGDDELEPQPSLEGGSDRLEGGAGNDLLNGGTEAQRTDPDVFGGGSGVDTVTYAARRAPLSVDLDGEPDDGTAGERDNVHEDVENVIGGSDSDSLSGSRDDNELDGGPGDDELAGGAGRDTLDGGANDGGSDRLDGGPDPDALQGGAGDDALIGGAGDDTLAGGGGADTLEGEDGQDLLEGGPGLDALFGGDGNDSMFGGAAGLLIGADGADELDGGRGDDLLAGGAGNDRLDGGEGGDQLNGDSGRDTLSYESRARPVSVTFDGVANDGEPGEHDNAGADIEIVLGGSVGDTLQGDRRANLLDGGSGPDDVSGGPGTDVLTGGTGIDVLRARDRAHDVVSCGGEGDLAIVDPIDTVRDCRYVDRGGRRRPVLGRTAVLRLTGGRFRLPESSRFVPLAGTLTIPFGSTVDPGAAIARVTTRQRRGGSSQQSEFWGGAFTVTQDRSRRPVTVITLRGGDFSKCSAAAIAGRGAHAAQSGPRRRVWGREDGGKRHRVRTKGRWSVGSVRGTKWLTEDRCDGTLTRVVSGSVSVRDLGLRRTVIVRAGERYLARARPRGRGG